MSDHEDQIIEVPKRPRKPLTDKQKEVRRSNLAKARVAKAANRQAKKAEPKKKKEVSYDLDESTESSSDEEVDMKELVLSKKKDKKKVKLEKPDPVAEMKKEMQELREIVHAVNKKQKQKARGTKLVLLPPNPPETKQPPTQEYTSQVRELMRIMERK